MANGNILWRHPLPPMEGEQSVDAGPVIAASQQTNDMFGEQIQAAMREGAFQYKVESNEEGEPEYTYKITNKELHDNIMQIFNTGKQAVASFSQEMAQLKAREDYTRQHGLFNLLSNLAGNFAQAKEMPGWVNALGKTSTDLNPTPDALMRQRMALQPGLMGALQQETMAAGQMIDLERNRIADEKSASAEALAFERLDLDRQKLEQADEASKLRDLSSLRTQMMGFASNGGYTEGMGTDTLIQGGMSPEMAAVTDKTLATASANILAAREAKDARAEAKAMAVAKETTARAFGVMEWKLKHPAGLNTVLGVGAAKWRKVTFNKEGKRIIQKPSPGSSMDAAIKAGFFPTEGTRFDGAVSALTLLQQIDELTPYLDEKGFMAQGPMFWDKWWAALSRGVESGDPKLDQFLMHASTMVSAARAVGDIGARALAAYESVIGIIKKPVSAAALKASVQNLRDAIVDAMPELSDVVGMPGASDEGWQTIDVPGVGKVQTRIK